MKNFSNLCDNCKTVSDLYYALSKFLSLNSIDAPQITSEYLVMAVLDFSTRVDLYLNFSKEVSATHIEKALSFAERRALQREPLEYITGKASFCGLEFKSDKRALIPRCDTETLVGRFFEIKREKPNIKRVLDLCTGSGIIGISIKKNFPEIEMYMSDISLDALSLASENCEKLSVDKICLIHSEGLSSFSHKAFDVIVSNPPYVEETAMASLEPEVVKWEPEIALSGGIDGLNFHKTYARNILEVLRCDGVFLCEIGGNIQADQLRKMYEKISKKVSFYKDINNLDRVMQVEK